MSHQHHSLRQISYTLGAMILLTSIHVAQADNWSLGVGVAVEKLPYHSYDTNTLPIPIINYNSQHFFIHGPSAGLYLFNNDVHKVSANLYYSPLYFDPSDTSDWAMKQLNKRRATIMAGIGYSYHADWGILHTEIATDILDNSQGTITDVAYQYRFTFNNFSITPGVGLQWQNRQYNEYYYGVDQDESLRSGLNQYTPDNHITPYLSVYADYSFNQNWHSFIIGRYNHLTSEVKNSPMVGKSYHAILGAGITYQF